MTTLIPYIDKLRDLFAGAADASAKFNDFSAKNPAGRLDEIGEVYEAQKMLWERKISDYLEKLLRFPPYHNRHNVKFEDFYQGGSYDQSVFIMTKFPDSAMTTESDKKLQAVLDATTNSIKKCGFVARMATRQYHPFLWDNVELHLLCCGRGIAIVEDRYRPELNPNVALEWGWMRGMGRQVLYLMEEKFNHNRADWEGLIYATFSWDSPDKNIDDAISKFLKP